MADNKKKSTYRGGTTSTTTHNTSRTYGYYGKSFSVNYTSYEKFGDYKLDLPLLKKVLSWQAESNDTEAQLNIVQNVVNYLREQGVEFTVELDARHNAYLHKVTNKDAVPVGCVAHLDQVHDDVDNYKVFGDRILFAMNMDSGTQVGTGGKIFLN